MSMSATTRRAAGSKESGSEAVRTAKCTPPFLSGMKAVGSNAKRRSLYFVSPTTPMISYCGSFGFSPPKCRPRGAVLQKFLHEGLVHHGNVVRRFDVGLIEETAGHRRNPHGGKEVRAHCVASAFPLSPCRPDPRSLHRKSTGCRPEGYPRNS